MTLTELRNICRQQLSELNNKNDITRFWPDANLTEYLNACVEEVCERTNCLRDSLTDAICLIPLVASQRHYALHDSILDILTVQPSWRSVPLDKQSVTTINSDWLTSTGLPTSYLLDYSSRTLSLSSVPAVITNESLRLTVSRLPLAEMSAATDVPAIASRYHRRLVDGVLAKAFSKQDAETYNPKKALTSQGDWERNLSSILRDEAKLNPRIYVARRVEF
jgi:hypothetical protein